MSGSGNRRVVHGRGLPSLAMAMAAALAALAARLDACTLWSVVGTNGAGGTVICKNRDRAPDHTQELKVVRPAAGYAYYGLFAVGGSEPGVKAGVNEKGLAVVTASASCLPKGRRDHQPGKHGVLARVLAGCASCDEVLAKKVAIFADARASFMLIADRTKALEVEVGLGGAYVVRPVASGFVAHTNHYLDPTLAAFNEKAGTGSAVRLGRVTQLLRAQPAPVSAEACAAISRDQHDGPDNSLWRTGKGVRTLASWIVELPELGPPVAHVVLANPGQREEGSRVVLDPAFWGCAR